MEIILPNESVRPIFYKVLRRTHDYMRTATVLKAYYNITIFLIPQCKYALEVKNTNITTWSKYSSKFN